jgi:epsin
MDLTSIKDSLSNLSIHDIKAGVRKVQNGKSRMLDWPVRADVVAVMNYTQMEAKVREATTNDPWGCSTTSVFRLACYYFLLHGRLLI